VSTGDQDLGEDSDVQDLHIADLLVRLIVNPLTERGA
jgi:hypothetical protein